MMLPSGSVWSLVTRVDAASCQTQFHAHTLDHRRSRAWCLFGLSFMSFSGILSDVILDGNVLHGWKMFPIPLQNLNNITNINPTVRVAESMDATLFSHKKSKIHSMITSTMPGIYKGHLKIDATNQVKDTFLSFEGRGKGTAFIDDFNLGRFWPLRGPQCNLYVRAPILRQGENVCGDTRVRSSNK